jgi:hypothetical protein
MLAAPSTLRMRPTQNYRFGGKFTPHPYMVFGREIFQKKSSRRKNSQVLISTQPVQGAKRGRRARAHTQGFLQGFSQGFSQVDIPTCVNYGL